MDSDKIIGYLKSYSTIGHTELMEITELQKKYPWFSNLYALESKCLKNENKFGFKKAIKKASLFSGNRELLYDFIHNDLELGKRVPPPVIKTPTLDKARETVNPLVPVEQPAPRKEEEVTVVDELLPDKTTPVVEAKTEEEPVVDSTPKEEIKDENTSKKVEPLKKKPHEVDKSKEQPKEIEKTDEPKLPVSPTYDPLVELQKLVKEPNEVKSKPIPTYDPEVELTRLSKEKEQKEEEPKDRQDFFGWLDAYNDEEMAKPKKEAKPRKLNMSPEASALLENFIKNRPTISRIRKDVDRLDVYNPVSQSPENEIVTESLAQLHLKQERPEKAIEIYEKLGLQNPEKFSYFAGLIEKIKKENNLE